MVVICDRCNTIFKTGGGLASHLRRRVPCGKEEDDVDLNADAGEEDDVDFNDGVADAEEANNVEDANDIEINLPKKGLNRDTIDKYYTNQNIAELCFDHTIDILNITDDDLIIEPSAGNGSFMNIIKRKFNNVKCYDIQPEHPDITCQDYLKLDVKELLENYPCIHVIGNPPFGRQASTAMKFVKKSCEFANTISFILPKSFKKDSLQKRIPPNFHLKFEVDLPANAFSVDGIIHDVPCVFQIWKKSDEKRKLPKMLYPVGYEICKHNQNPVIAFRRVGVNAGTFIKDNIGNLSQQSHYFIKFNKPLTEDLYARIQTIKYEHNNTSGPKSVSRQELIEKMNKLSEELT